MAGQPPTYNNCLDLEFMCDMYFDECKEDGLHPTISGLAVALNMSRRSITNYKNRDEFFPTIKKARLKVEAYLEQKLFGNSVTGVIFNLKNNFDWKDKTEVDQTTEHKLAASTKEFLTKVTETDKDKVWEK